RALGSTCSAATLRGNTYSPKTCATSDLAGQVTAVDHPAVGVCLDVGHAAVAASVFDCDYLEECAAVAPSSATSTSTTTWAAPSPTPSSTAGRVFSFPPAALAKALLRVVGDPKLTARMGQDGRERAARLFSWESIARDHLALFGV
ncbi:MAG: hypothetical protein ACJ73Y_04860, partial [Rubrobacteraceae bacterium]